jgi:DNA-binding IclR family transcriptional regulator
MRDANFTVDNKELAPGRVSIARPIRNEDRDVVSAIDLVTPSSASPSTSSLPRLTHMAHRISARLTFVATISDNERFAQTKPESLGYHE